MNPDEQHQDRRIPLGEEIETLLGRLRPKPGRRFYERMMSAPWKNDAHAAAKSLIFRIGFPIGAVLMFLATFSFISSNLRPTHTPTYTSAATITATSSATPASTLPTDEILPQSPAPTPVPLPETETSSAYSPVGLQDSPGLT
jgi:hypothetical protein